jgi:MFS family permease
VGIGKEAREHKSFIWWVVNRLLFLAAVGSIQGFAFFYMQDYLSAENPGTMTTILLAFVGVFLIPSALGGGYLADRVGRKRLVLYAGLIAVAGFFQWDQDGIRLPGNLLALCLLVPLISSRSEQSSSAS